MARSPIEMMVDKACGFSQEDIVKLRCPACGKEKYVAREAHDLPGTHTIEANCPDCPADGFEEVLYFREDGTQIFDEDADESKY